VTIGIKDGYRNSLRDCKISLLAFHPRGELWRNLSHTRKRKEGREKKEKKVRSGLGKTGDSARVVGLGSKKNFSSRGLPGAGN
jgi:hypothetical protein